MFKHVCGETNHKFEEFLVKVIVPKHFPAMESRGESLSVIIDAMSDKEYETRCKYCGKKAE